MLIIFILFVATIFCLIIYNVMFSKELSISILLGYNKLNLPTSKIVNLLAMPIITGLVLIIDIIGYLVDSNDILEFIISMKVIFILLMLIIALLIAI